MADDLHYVPGEFYRICDRTGFKIRDTKTRKEWTGLYVRDQSWEPRNAQDFVTGVRDDQTVWDARPRQTNVFVGPASTVLIANAAAGAAIVSVNQTIGFSAGDRIGIMLDTGVMYVAIISQIVGTTFILDFPAWLAFNASIGNIVVDYAPTSRPFSSGFSGGFGPAQAL